MEREVQDNHYIHNNHNSNEDESNHARIHHNQQIQYFHSKPIPTRNAPGSYPPPFLSAPCLMEQESYDSVSMPTLDEHYAACGDASWRSGLSDCEIPPAEAEAEAYLEMDYAAEMADCARYTFSPAACVAPTGGAWLSEQRRQRAAERAAAAQQWADGLRAQHDAFLRAHGRTSLRLLLAEARRGGARRDWAALADRLRAAAAVPPDALRLTLSAMCLFDRTAAPAAGDGAARAAQLRGRREALLEQLRARGALFLPTAGRAAHCRADETEREWADIRSPESGGASGSECDSDGCDTAEEGGGPTSPYWGHSSPSMQPRII